jgi:hypothetical protein
MTGATYDGATASTPTHRGVLVSMAVATRPEISRERPGLFVFLIDQSLSMGSQFLDTPYSKAQAVAYTVNQTIHNLILSCMPYGEVEDYYHFAAVGYGGAERPSRRSVPQRWLRTRVPSPLRRPHRKSPHQRSTCR